MGVCGGEARTKGRLASYFIAEHLFIQQIVLCLLCSFEQTLKRFGEKEQVREVSTEQATVLTLVRLSLSPTNILWVKCRVLWGVGRVSGEGVQSQTIFTDSELCSWRFPVVFLKQSYLYIQLGIWKPACEYVVRQPLLVKGPLPFLSSTPTCWRCRPQEEERK